MSNYTKATDFAEKDGLPTNDPNKVIKGAEFEDEFDLIATAVNSKADTASPTFTGTVTLPTVDIDGGNIDGTVIGGTTAAAGSFTTGFFSGTVSFADNAKVSLGTGNDLEIYHDGSNSYVTEQGDGSLIIKSNGDGIVFRNSIGSNYVSMLESTGEAKLFHISGGVATSRLTTSATGIDVNGDTSTDTLTLNGTEVTSTATELNVLDGITATTAELNLVDGLTAIPDYVTGTFTPVVADAASGGNTATVGTAVGRYTKVGRMVHVTIQLVNITTTGMSGSVYVRDLPFTAYDSGSPNMLWMGTLYASQVTTGTDGPFVPQIIDNTDYIQFIRSITSSSQVTPLAVSNLTSGASDMYVSISYEAA